jgi:hypothetical protein
VSGEAGQGGSSAGRGMPRLEHFVMTNFNVYRTDTLRDKKGGEVRTPEWLEERFDLFERFCLPSIVAQTCQDFTWIVKYDGKGTPQKFINRLLEHEAAVPNMRLEPRAISFRMAIARILGERRCRLLTTRLDNDDAFHRTALERVQREAGDDGVEFLNFPFGYSLSYPEGEVRLFEYHSNPFVSLVEDYTGEEPLTACCTSSGQVSEVAPLRQLDPEPSWIQVVHGRNAVNILQGELCEPPALGEAFNSEFEPAGVR